MSRHERTHPPTLLTLARRTLERECGEIRGAHVVAAVSGGRDSMALLHVLHKLSGPLGFTLSAIAVDHGLRKTARVEILRAETFAAALGVPFDTAQLTLDGKAGNLQERARDARYAILYKALREHGDRALLATAHHADDRAETVLIRLMRGASALGLAVLPPRAGVLIRPFVRATRAAVDAHVARHAVPYSDDPSNDDPRFLRTRVRREVLPLLRELSPGIVAHLCGVADDAAVARGDQPDIDALPRATRAALRALEVGRSARARVALPGGREARFDRETHAIVIEPTRPRARRS